MTKMLKMIDDEDVGNTTSCNYVNAEMSFNSLMPEIFGGSNNEEVIQLCLCISRCKWKTFACLEVVLH